MVKQGDIIRTNFSPQSGHEQAGPRPAVIVSNNVFNEKVRLVLACPITNARREFPLHVPLDDRTKTTGFVLCQHIKALDINTRGYSVIERIPDDILDVIIGILFSEIRRTV
ncbi:MAG: type II toxin-antitoxin system PemK/MazF family toxin [Peptococcaceae bacterium]|nr:type II toxin-antitoxin system PemK/MazF family toxin [Peptococcaceae bacterium]